MVATLAGRSRQQAPSSSSRSRRRINRQQFAVRGELTDTGVPRAMRGAPLLYRLVPAAGCVAAQHRPDITKPGFRAVKRAPHGAPVSTRDRVGSFALRSRYLVALLREVGSSAAGSPAADWAARRGRTRV